MNNGEFQYAKLEAHKNLPFSCSFKKEKDMDVKMLKFVLVPCRSPVDDNVTDVKWPSCIVSNLTHFQRNTVWKSLQRNTHLEKSPGKIFKSFIHLFTILVPSQEIANLTHRCYVTNQVKSKFGWNWQNSHVFLITGTRKSRAHENPTFRECTWHPLLCIKIEISINC